MRYLIFIYLVFCILTPALPIRAEQPKWSLALKGGYVIPETDGWEDHYGDDGFWSLGAEFGWKINRRLELNASISYGDDSGKAITPSGKESVDALEYNQLPIHVSILYRFISHEDQLIVPFIGGGYTHLFYRLEFIDDKRSGDQFGYHVRSGFQILLDRLDPNDADDISDRWGINNSYLFFEGIYSNVDDFGSEDIDLGGWAVFIGLLLEF
jgi:hypothetical protein